MYSFMPYLRINLFLVSLILITLGCKEKHNTAKETTPIYQSQEFLDFYNKYSTDSLYQMQHTVFPLEGMKSPTDSTTIDPDFRWNENEWVLHSAFNDANGDFTREFVEVGGIVFEFISDLSGTFTMERRFAKLSSGWHLIYYREMGKYQ